MSFRSLCLSSIFPIALVFFIHDSSAQATKRVGGNHSLSVERSSKNSERSGERHVRRGIHNNRFFSTLREINKMPTILERMEHKDGRPLDRIYGIPLVSGLVGIAFAAVPAAITVAGVVFDSQTGFSDLSSQHLKEGLIYIPTAMAVGAFALQTSADLLRATFHLAFEPNKNYTVAHLEMLAKQEFRLSLSDGMKNNTEKEIQQKRDAHEKAKNNILEELKRRNAN